MVSSYQAQPGPKFLKKKLNSTGKKFIMLINGKMPNVSILTFISMINTTSKSFKARKVFIFQQLGFYEQLIFHALLS